MDREVEKGLGLGCGAASGFIVAPIILGLVVMLCMCSFCLFSALIGSLHY